MRWAPLAALLLVRCSGSLSQEPQSEPMALPGICLLQSALKLALPIQPMEQLPPLEPKSFSSSHLLSEGCKDWLQHRQLPSPVVKVSALKSLRDLSPELRDDVCASYAGHATRVRRACNATAQLSPGERLIYFIRHGEGYHNADVMGGFIQDPKLTPRGRQQALNLRHNWLLSSALSTNPALQAELVVVSPMRRTLETAILALNASLPASTVPWKIDPDIQEVGDMPCDVLNATGGLELLEEMGRRDLVGPYSQMRQDCFSKTGRYAPDDDAVQARFADFTARLLQDVAGTIVVVAHSALLNVGLGSWTGDEFNGPLFDLGEVRPYALAGNGTYRKLCTAA